MNNVNDHIEVYYIPEYNGFAVNANYTDFSERTGKEIIDYVIKSETRILIAVMPIDGSM